MDDFIQTRQERKGKGKQKEIYNQKTVRIKEALLQNKTDTKTNKTNKTNNTNTDKNKR